MRTDVVIEVLEIGVLHGDAAAPDAAPHAPDGRPERAVEGAVEGDVPCVVVAGAGAD